MSPIRTTATWLAAALLGAPAATQEHQHDIPRIEVHDGRIAGIGPGYRAEFHQDHCSFAAESEPLLQWTLESVGRKNGEMVSLTPVTSAQPEFEGRMVRYVRGSLTERYEIREDGVEQSFVFERIPEGTGDLTVRLRLDTDLAPSAPNADVSSLTFADHGGNAVSIGVVTGIDASGNRVSGSMRCSGEHLDLRLPSDFVDRATLPLLLDPLISGTLTIGTGPGGNPYSEVAYDATNDVFLVMWSTGNIPNAKVIAWRVDPTGQKIGQRVIPTTTGSPANVANIAAADCFVLTYAESSGTPYAVTIDAATGTPSIPVPIDGVGDLAGEVGPHRQALTVWSHGRTVHAGQILIDASGTPSMGESTTLGRGWRPVISKTGGSAGRFLVAWNTRNGIDGAVINRDLETLDHGPIVRSDSTLWPRVDGDGTKWLLAYRIYGDTRCRPIFWDTYRGSGYLGNETILAEYDPVYLVAFDPNDVLWAGGSYLVTVGAVGSFGGADFLHSVDTFDAQPCEGQFLLAAGSQMAGQMTGDPNGGDLVFLSDHQRAQLFRVDDGITTDLGGGCVGGGTAHASCAVAGNAGFTLRVRNAAPNQPTLAIVGTNNLGFACGPCTLVSDPADAVVASAGLTDDHGNAALQVPLTGGPSLVGATFLLQWVTVGGGACGSGLGFSNALQVQVQ